MKYFAALLLSAVLFVACGDDSSSSAPVPDPSEESSSSVEKTNESSSSAKPTSSEDKQSSSSVKKEDSSSSAVKASSSSVTPKSSSSAKSSSSVTPKSSSSVKSSSSFEVDTARLCTPDYDLCDRALSGDSIRSGAYKQFTDKRNGRKYYYLTINGENKDGQAASVTVMAENLNIGEMVDGAKDQSNDSKIERYCYENDESNCEEFGGLYQWAEMMQLPSECNTKSCADQIKPKHQGICPDGWRLLTYDDFYIVVHADGNDDPLVEGVRAMGFGGHNYSGYSLIGGGVMDYDGETPFADLNESAYWYYPEEQDKRENRAAGTFVNKSLNTFSKGYNSKSDGFSVRCVMVE